MHRHLLNLTTVALLSGGLLFPALHAADKTTAALAAHAKVAGVTTADLHPFTHFADIPASADLGTIRFEKARLVQVPTKIHYTMDADYCGELAFGDPGGSMACPSTKTGTLVPAYQVTYSFTGQPLASDEYAGRNFTFSVYFQLNELAQDAREALSARQLSRSDAAAYFAVSTDRENAVRVVIDGLHSHFCAGNHVDGVWVRTDAGCEDTVRYTEVTAPSDYITVRIDPVSSRAQQAGVSARIVSAK